MVPLGRQFALPQQPGSFRHREATQPSPSKPESWRGFARPPRAPSGSSPVSCEHHPLGASWAASGLPACTAAEPGDDELGDDEPSAASRGAASRLLPVCCGAMPGGGGWRRGKTGLASRARRRGRASGAWAARCSEGGGDAAPGEGGGAAGGEGCGSEVDSGTRAMRGLRARGWRRREGRRWGGRVARSGLGGVERGQEGGVNGAWRGKFIQNLRS